MNLINKKIAIMDTPSVSLSWRKKNEKLRIEEIENYLSKEQKYNIFKVINAPDNGQIVLKTQKSFDANIRGMFLLDLENFLKNKIDNGLTVWLEPVGDKSKLRNLRGIKVKSV